MSDAPQWINDFVKAWGGQSKTIVQQNGVRALVLKHYLASIQPGAQALAERIAIKCWEEMDGAKMTIVRGAKITPVIVAELAPLYELLRECRVEVDAYASNCGTARSYMLSKLLTRIDDALEGK